MEILDRKSDEIQFFFRELERMREIINLTLKNRASLLNGEKFLTGKDACRMLHVSARTLYQWRKEGKIPFLQIGGKMLYQESKVLEWLDKQQA